MYSLPCPRYCVHLHLRVLTYFTYSPHMFITICFILFYIINVLNIDVPICMDDRRIGCWSPVVSSIAYIFTVYMSCYKYFVSDMYCMHQAKEIKNKDILLCCSMPCPWYRVPLHLLLAVCYGSCVGFKPCGVLGLPGALYKMIRMWTKGTMFVLRATARELFCTW